MTEIKKITKISLIVVAIITFLFGIMLVFLWDLTLNTEGWTNPFHPFDLNVCNVISWHCLLYQTKRLNQ